ncbi:MAG: CoA-transferase [Proteobacteria bacterium]|nr:MAG: CoA-transferase [Pseudomonadota bacterium]
MAGDEVSAATRAEICAVAMADAFRGDGEILVSCFGTVPAIGARLARLTFAPDLLLTDGIAHLLADVQPVSGKPSGDPVIEGWLPFRAVFDLLWSGRRHVVMMASQIDRFGNHNFACIGPHARPKAQLLGMRGAPGNTVSHPTSYWVPAHTAKVFVEQVDVVSGVGYDRAAKLGAGARFHEIRRVVSNLGVFDFATDDRTMRLASLHPGVTLDDVRAATSFPLATDADVATTREPTAEELRLIRDVLDPERLRDREVPS